MRDGNEIARARDALNHLDPGCDRDTWLRIGFAAIAAGLSVAEIDAWSSNASNYKGDQDVRAAFKKVEPDGGITEATLFYLARAEGWESANDPSERTGTRVRPARATARPAEPARIPRPAMSPFEVWDRCQPATAEHGYIGAKQGAPNGLRVVPEGDPLRIAGQSVVGWLVVPVLPIAGGEPASLQFIPPPGTGRKLNLPDAPIAGVFVVGKLLTGGVVYVCEGIGQAWACWKATGHASVVCFGSGRMRAVAAELRMHDPTAGLVLVPDVGQELHAETIARDVQAKVAVMPDGWPHNSDVNDLGLRDGFDVVEEVLCHAIAPSTPERRFKLLGGADVHRLQPLMWRVREVLPAHGLACVYGPSGVGKSFLVLDLAAKIAEGGDWFGHRVIPSPAVYVCLEGVSGLRRRVEAWVRHNGRPLPAGLTLVVDPFKLTSPQDVHDLGDAVLTLGSGAVTFVDTLNASAPGIDENSSKDMGTVIESAKTLQVRTGGLVVVVHHTGKEAAKGLRGHSSLIAALDAAIEVFRAGDRQQWKIAKSKDGEDGGVHPFRLEKVFLAPDSDGELDSSCVVMAEASIADVKQTIKQAKVPSGVNQRLVMNGIRPLFTVSLTNRSGVPAMRPALELEVAVAAGATCLTCQPDKRTSRARAAIAGLIGNGVFGLNDGWLWIP